MTESFRVLVACEFTGVVRRAFAARGHDAWSCDLLPAEDGSNRHLVGDVRDHLDAGWDLLIVAHPPCTRLCRSGRRWLSGPGDMTPPKKLPRGRSWASMIAEFEEGVDLFVACWRAPVPRVAIENPEMHDLARRRMPPDVPKPHVVQPFWFGHPEYKGTGWYLRGLPGLVETNRLAEPEHGSDEWKAWNRVWRLAPWIIAHMPAHRVYVEPFGGAASVLMRKPRANAEVYNDLDDSVVHVFRTLQCETSARELARRLSLTPYARAEFERSYDPPTDDIDRALKTIVRSFMGFGTDSVTRTCRTGFRASLTGSANTFPAREWGAYAHVVEIFTQRLSGVLIEQRPAIEIMARADGPMTLHFVDPPYLHGTRSAMANGRATVHGYAHELTDADHADLLDFLDALTGMVVLCGYPDALYDDRLSHWRRVSIRALADGAREREEVLWLNPACAAALDARHGGHGTPLFGAKQAEAAE